MTADAADQTPSERDAAASERTPGGGETGDRPAERHECYGPLSLLRTSKDDGRALLLFSHPAEERER
jgi:hypothetical protein